MSQPTALIAAWARSAVAPYGGAFRALHAHAIGAPVLQALLQRAGIRPDAVDAVVLGNALGAGGNPARMLALAAGLPERCAALSVDTQCCSGLDAVAMAVGLLASGQASVVVAGGVEAWSRAPIRQTRPLHAGEAPVAYERPAFAPDPARDPDLLASAADYAQAQGSTRVQQDAYA
ncbi:MAG: acetyl-CoA C-acyltransferase, partial [Rhodoferax sp.]|nr:acetyl-CoA C-acyltransferase [Rhodoferax sp.]